MTNSKKDSELEEIIHKYCGASKTQYLDGDFVLPEVIEAEAVQAIKALYITKEESDRRVLEARIEQLRRAVSQDLPIGGDLSYYFRDRIAELRELLNGDKE